MTPYPVLALLLASYLVVLSVPLLLFDPISGAAALGCGVWAVWRVVWES